MTHRLKLALAALPVLAFAPAAWAAGEADPAIAAAKNQLGVLEYCQTAGHIDATGVEAQTKLLATLPEAADTATVDAAYEAGKAGNISALGTQQSLADAATAQGSTEAALCEQISNMVIQAAGQIQG